MMDFRWSSTVQLLHTFDKFHKQQGNWNTNRIDSHLVRIWINRIPQFIYSWSASDEKKLEDSEKNYFWQWLQLLRGKFVGKRQTIPLQKFFRISSTEPSWKTLRER